MKNKHLTLDERIIIQEGINKGLSFNEISKLIGKSRSTVSREVIARRCIKKSSRETPFPCLHLKNCKEKHLCCDFHDCNEYCKECSRLKLCINLDCHNYLPKLCSNISKPPYVCNTCPRNRSNCSYTHYIYIATYAESLYQDKLISSRQGINQTPEKLDEIDNMVSPLIMKGQPISHIYASHAEELSISKATLYRYLDKSLLTARNLDLHRRVRYKVRKTHTRPTISKEEKSAVKERDFECFLKYVTDHPDESIVEMDTVVGRNDSKKVLLTLLFRNCSLMIAILLPNKTQGSVIAALNTLCEAIGIEYFRAMFNIILTDRGTEFLNPEAIECDQYGEIKTHLFYCDPQCSWQKGKLERNHEFIRYVLPKGSSFDDYNQEDITLMVNHINSLKRKKLNDHSPYELSKITLNSKLHQVLKLKEIAADDVTLNPSLLEK